MNFLDWSTVAGLVTIAIFLWRLTHTLNRDMHKMGEKMSDLGERIAKIEGALFHAPIEKGWRK